MAAEIIAAASSVLESSRVVMAQKSRRLCSGDGIRVRLSPQARNAAREDFRSARVCHETLRKVRLGKRLVIGVSSRRARRCVTLALVADASGYEEGGVDVEIGTQEDRVTEGDEGDIASPSGRGDGAECGVRFGRRMLLGSVFTAVALSEFGRPGLALSEGDGGNEKVKVKGGDSSAGVENGEGETAGPQFGEKWKMSRVYDATALGEPLAVGGDRGRVWQKLLQARVVYLGEAERVPDPDDRVTTAKRDWIGAFLGFAFKRVPSFALLALE
jgi:hypothetical protein